MSEFYAMLIFKNYVVYTKAAMPTTIYELSSVTDDCNENIIFYNLDLWTHSQNLL